MASLQARHSRKCALSEGKGSAVLTPFELPKGCTCTPSYFIDAGIVNGEKVRVSLPKNARKNRKLAQRELNALRKDRDDGTFEPPKDVTFAEYAAEWLASLRRPKANTVESYKTTIEYGKTAFGDKKLRAIVAADVDRFLGLLAKVSASTQAKHLRVLNSMFRAAVLRGYMPRNPVERLDRSQRPQTEKREAAYFTNDELKRLVAVLPEGLHRALVRVALWTGLRAGELAALTWADVNLTEALIHVRRNFTAGELSTPKSVSSAREVDLHDAAVELLGQWWSDCGKPKDEALVFPGPAGYLPYWTFTRGILYPGLERAKIERVGPTGEKRTFHSLRHSHAKVALESGMLMTALSRSLGHSSIQVTDKTYGHFERSARRSEAAKVKFPV